MHNGSWSDGTNKECCGAGVDSCVQISWKLQSEWRFEIMFMWMGGAVLLRWPCLVTWPTWRFNSLNTAIYSGVLSTFRKWQTGLVSRRIQPVSIFETSKSIPQAAINSNLVGSRKLVYLSWQSRFSERLSRPWPRYVWPAASWWGELRPAQKTLWYYPAPRCPSPAV